MSSNYEIWRALTPLQAIVKCAQSEGSHGDLYRSISSAIFLGTPHRGMHTSTLESRVKAKPPEDLVRDLAPGSLCLRRLNEDFSLISGDVAILTCYELRETPTVVVHPDGSWKRTGPKVMMVDKESACLYINNEKRVPVNENHSDIAKTSEDSEGHYRIVKNWLEEQAVQGQKLVQAHFRRRDLRQISAETSRVARFVCYCTKRLCPGIDSETLDMLRAESLFFNDFADVVMRPELTIIFQRSSVLGAGTSIVKTVSEAAALLSPYTTLAMQYGWLNVSAEEPLDRFDIAQSQDPSAGVLSSVVMDRGQAQQFFRKELLQHVANQIRTLIVRLYQSISLFILGASIQDLELWEGSSTLRQTGLDQVARRQLLLQTEPSSLAPLPGHLIEFAHTTSDAVLRTGEYADPNSTESIDVIIEHKTVGLPSGGYRPTSDPDMFGGRLRQRIRNLASLLQKSRFGLHPTAAQHSFEPVFHTFRCLGYQEEQDSDDISLVFDIPPTHSLGIPRAQLLRETYTLRTLIEQKVRIPLEDRFKIAVALSHTVLNLHSSGWVHKNIWPENVVLFPSNLLGKYDGPGDSSSATYLPFLRGFEYSRLSSSPSDLIDPSDMINNLYRHPERQGSPGNTFTKKHDIYALGVVLLDLGIGKSVEQRYQKKLNSFRATGTFPQPLGIYTDLVEFAKKELPTRMGSRYTEAVRKCLEDDFGIKTDDKQQTQLGLAVQAQVVDVLSEGSQL